MFITTIINFLLSSVNAGTQVAIFIIAIRKFFILDIDHPLSERPELVNSMLQDAILVAFWAVTLPVSIKPSLLDPVSIHARWRYCLAISLSSGGLGPSSQIDSG